MPAPSDAKPRSKESPIDPVQRAGAEAVGAKRLDGVAKNLAAMLEDKSRRGNYHEVTDRADAPLEDAVALMVRERLTGLPPPTSGKPVVDLWRDWIEEKAGG